MPLQVVRIEVCDFKRQVLQVGLDSFMRRMVYQVVSNIDDRGLYEYHLVIGPNGAGKRMQYLSFYGST
jgi:hypothetical protein